MARKVVNEVTTGMQLELEDLRKQVAGLQEQVRLREAYRPMEVQGVTAELDAQKWIAIQNEVRKFALQLSKFDVRLNALEYRMQAARL